jgi:hypothetical protein
LHLQNQAKAIGKHDENNTLDEMIKATEQEYGLTNALINKDIVKTRVKMSKQSVCLCTPRNVTSCRN